jgi:hypothetical protein
LLLKATETECPYKSRRRFAWAVKGKIEVLTEYRRGWLNKTLPAQKWVAFWTSTPGQKLALICTKVCKFNFAT